MGLLSDDPVSAAGAGDGQKFIDLYTQVLDDEDRERIRRWVDDPTFTVSEIARRLAQHFPVSRSTVERGIARLKASSWEC